MDIPATMRAVVCETPGPVSVLQIRHVPVPVPEPGQILIKVLAFGINRAEMFTRQGHSPGVQFPRILGIELVGRVAGYATGEVAPIPIGTLVATCMGGLGREIPGSYAEYACQSCQFVLPFPDISLDLATVAALPEMLQTTYGSLTEALSLQPGESLLIRGATSSIGLAGIQLAKYLGASRIGATSRSAGREALLRSSGADIVYVDDGSVAKKIPTEEQFDKVLELIGTRTLKDSILCLKPKGTVCMTGIQGGEWAFSDFSPITDLPQRRRLTSYGGDQHDFMSMSWQELISAVKDGKINIPIRQFNLDQIQDIHTILESGGGGHKMVVVI
ncbi:zinc-binding oxidoreductase, putative [Cordyceps militaris CM01]|uniref:Zinc-binding oxidoreductase, putative n=1 Tax=Cordyceps militaris (strain CM01) TaxID=983644 RepID=G3J6F8_CORMM|nr:zinc-binding oxidoreductase, putative [Cordyceps militaris CM01]EGX96192.1 zinc-binding oxidoreductase, putative [Cordyceps militaris CM01]